MKGHLWNYSSISLISAFRKAIEQLLLGTALKHMENKQVIRIGLWSRNNALTNMFGLEKKGWDETSLLSTTTWKEIAVRWMMLFFPQLTCDRMQRNDLKMHQGKFRLDIRNNFFMVGVIKHCKCLPKEVMEMPSLEVFQSHLDVVLRDIV